MVQHLMSRLVALGIASVALIGLLSAPAVAQQVAGPATIIDGDSLSVNGIRIRLFGIDAPEGKQTCQRGERRGLAAKSPHASCGR
jgi:endonuclease YncB( thermonuclease family)